MSTNHHPKLKIFKYSMIAIAVIALTANTVNAEEVKNKANSIVEKTADTKPDIETLLIIGQRGNLISAQNMKMNSDTVMDAISSEDIGAMPDRSVLEAVSRMPGVAIERFAAGDDPDHFGVEGGGVVVRGLTFVRSEFNGRDSFSADSGRGLSFEDVSPDLMGSVELYKNQTADMIEGGIAGTLSLNTRKAFDSAGRVFAFSADATYTDLREETTPTFSALYSDIWENDLGRWGLLVNASSSSLKVESNAVQVGVYEKQNRQIEGKDIYVPDGVRLSKKQDDSERSGFASSLQWENPDRTILLTGEYIRSEATLGWNENVIEMDDDDSKNNLLPINGTEFEFDDNGYFESGIITSEAEWRGDGSPKRYGMQQNTITRARDDESIVNDISFNAKFTPNDSWAIDFDIQYIDAAMQIKDVQVSGATRAVVALDLGGVGIPGISLVRPSYDGQLDNINATPFTNPTNNFWRHALDHVSDNDGQEIATRLDAEYTFDDSLISAVQFGVRYSNREQTTRQSLFNWGVLSESFAGGNIYYADTDVPYEEVSFENFSRNSSLGIDGGNNLLFPSKDIVENYAGLNDALANTKASGATWVPLAHREGAIGHFLPNEINQTEETSNAAYIKFDFEGDIGDFYYSANVGLRYVKLNNETAGATVFPVGPKGPEFSNEPGFEPDELHKLRPDQLAFSDGTSIEKIVSSSYSNVLPSFNLKLDVTDEVLVRVGFSEAISLPSLGNLRSHVGIQGDGRIRTTDPVTTPGEEPETLEFDRFVADSGNPLLKPMESYNYDLSLEWYFSEVGILTTSLFYKDIKNYFISGVTVTDFTNNGVTQPVEVKGSTNGDEGTIKGLEVSYQQFFDTLPGAFSGLGVQLNYTRINEEGSPNSGLNDSIIDTRASEFAFDNLPLEGLSEQSANAALLYEKYDISARIAYSWRSDYLLTSRDVITSLPIYNEANGQLDASIFWDVSDNWKLGLQGTNLNNNITETTMQINQEGDRKTRSWFTNDRRYSLVVRANF